MNVTGFAATIAVMVLLFFIVIAGTLIGGIAGWCVGLFFDDTLAALKAFLGVDVTNFQLGAALGFVGGFFKGSTTVTSN